MRVISETNRRMHQDHLHTLKLRLSIFEKSYPETKGKGIGELGRIKLPYGERERLRCLLSDIYAHELFFSSLSDKPKRCEKVRGKYGSEASFLYSVLSDSIDVDGGFILIYIKRDGGIGVYAGRDLVSVFSKYDVRLAVDLCEHAYFYDYGFDKKSYLRAALSSLDLSKIENTVEKKEI